MSNVPNNKTRTKWVDEVIVPTGTTAREQIRGLGDLPADISPGAREVSMLTAISRAHAKALPEVYDALAKLAALPNWSGRFLVADKADYNWRTAPWRHYESFADFYRRELEETWGKWSDLQETWRKVVKGELTNEQGKKIVLQRLSPPEIMAVASKLPEAMSHAERGKRGGRGKKAGVHNTSFIRGSTNAPYLAARLKRDAPEIAARIDEFPSMRAAAIEAGIIKTEKPLTIIRRAWKKASATEREQMIAWINEQAAG